MALKLKYLKIPYNFFQINEPHIKVCFCVLAADGYSRLYRTFWRSIKDAHVTDLERFLFHQFSGNNNPIALPVLYDFIDVSEMLPPMRYNLFSVSNWNIPAEDWEPNTENPHDPTEGGEALQGIFYLVDR